MHICVQAVSYVIEHRCHQVIESDSDMDIMAIYSYWMSKKEARNRMHYLTRVDARGRVDAVGVNAYYL